MANMIFDITQNVFYLLIFSTTNNKNYYEFNNFNANVREKKQ